MDGWMDGEGDAARMQEEQKRKERKERVADILHHAGGLHCGIEVAQGLPASELH